MNMPETTVKQAGTDLKDAKASTKVDVGTLILLAVREKGGMFSIKATEALLKLKRAKEISFECIDTSPGLYGNSERVRQIMAVQEVNEFLNQKFGEPATITPRGRAWLDDKLREYFPDESKREHIIELMREIVR